MNFTHAWDESEYVHFYILEGTFSFGAASMRTAKHPARPRGYKTFFMLNSAEHEIFSANKYENANDSWHFHIY